MSEHDLEKLLGGFAADTLTAEERDALFRAALQDQQLFNALADEQALKELLADPAVRRRLLQSLTHQRDAGRWPSWLYRFTQPAGLAWAGGIAAGVFAVVLGLNVYEDSMRQASETAALEEVKPSVPSIPPAATLPDQAPLPKTTEKAPKTGPPAKPTTKDAPTDTSKSRELDAVSRRKGKTPPEVNESEQRATVQKQEMQTKEFQKMDSPVAALGKSSGQQAPSSGERPLASPPPAATAESKKSSAKAFFYAGPSGQDMALSAREESGHANEPQLFAPTRKALDRSSPIKPLALRYQLMVRGTEGQERDLNATAAVNQTGTILLKIESNQEAYLQIWKRAGDSLPELVLPAKETGRISLKIAENQGQELIVPPESDRVTIRLSRVPFGPITRQEAVLAGRGSPGQLVDSRPEEEATYVANPDPSIAGIAVDIPLGTHAAP